MKYDLDRYIDRRSSDSAKWHQYGEDVLALWVADMDFMSAQPILDALHNRVDHGIFGYTHSKLFDGLHQTIQERLERLYNWHVEADEIIFLSGVVVGFNLACHATGNPGDDVLVQPPVYYPFLSAPGNAGRQTRYAQIQRAGNSYEIDMAAFERTMTDRTSLFILCNPHNPIGRVFRQDELEQMAEICLRHDVVICSDEIHCDLVFDGHKHVPIASLSPEIAQNTITLMAPSKTFNIPGLGCSLAIVQNPELRKRYLAASGGLLHGVNILGYAATLAAYRDSQEWLDQVLAYLEDNCNFLRQYVDRQLPGIDMVELEGTYLAWLDCRDTPIAEKPAQFFLEQAHVGLNEGTKFGPGGEGYARLNFACPRSTLVEALNKMKSAYEKQLVDNS